MEIGFQFEEEIFGNPSERNTKKDEAYKPKWCEEGWIESASLPEDPADRVHIIKFIADQQFSKGSHNQALAGYDKALSSLGPNFQVGLLKQEITEAKARCLNKLGMYQEALVLMHELVQHQGDDASYWFLIAELNRNLHNLDGELKALQRCVSLHTWSVNFWHHLAEAYEKAERVAIETLRNERAYQCKHTCKNTGCVAYSSINLSTDDENLHKQLLCCPIKNDLASFLVDSNDSCNKTLRSNFSTSTHNNKLCTNEELSDSMIVWYNTKSCCCRNRQSCCSLSSKKNVNDVESEKTPTGSTKSTSAVGHCVNHSTKNVNDITNDLSTFHLSSKNGCINAAVPPGRELHCIHMKGNTEKFCTCKSSDCNTRSQANTREMFHLFSFCCLIRTRFLLKRAYDTSGSFVRENISRISRQIDDKIASHGDCKCHSVLPMINKRLASEKNEKEEKKDTTNGTMHNKVTIKVTGPDEEAYSILSSDKKLCTNQIMIRDY